MLKLYFFNSGEFGFTKLVGVDYGSYAPEEKGFLDQKLGNSFHCAASVMQVQVALNKSRTLYFATDLRFAVDNYRLANAGIRLGYEKGPSAARGAGRTRRQIEIRHFVAGNSAPAYLQAVQTFQAR